MTAPTRRSAAIRADGLPGTIDPVTFARESRSLDGETGLDHLPRLREAGVLALEGPLQWRVDGERARDALERLREFLYVQVRFHPTLTCIRCLEPVLVDPIDGRGTLRLAASDAQAAVEDREAGDVDVIAASGPVDFAQLVEDEAMLALPMAPAHETCPAREP